MNTNVNKNRFGAVRLKAFEAMMEIGLETTSLKVKVWEEPKTTTSKYEKFSRNASNAANHRKNSKGLQI